MPKKKKTSINLQDAMRRDTEASFKVTREDRGDCKWALLQLDVDDKTWMLVGRFPDKKGAQTVRDCYVGLIVGSAMEMVKDDLGANRVDGKNN